MWTSAHFDVKIVVFFEICSVSARTWGWASADKGEGVNLSRFCADVLYGRPLIVTEK